MAEATGELPSFRLDGRVAVVTGAGLGIGRAIAEAYARAGAYLILAARNEARLAEVKRTIEAAGGSAEVVRTDVTKLGDLRVLGDRVAAVSAERDADLVLVNNAGFGFTKPAFEVTEEDLDLLMDTHLKGTFFCSQQVGRTMVERGYGKIVNLGSAWGDTSAPKKVPYCTVKAGVAHMTRGFSSEWAPHGVRVNALAPTATMTEFTADVLARDPERAKTIAARIPLGRFAVPTDHVGAALFLASPASDFVTGQILYVDGGLTAV